MKFLIAACVAMSLSGCLTGGSPGPTKLPDGFDLGMWSAKPVTEVQACIARLGPAGTAFSVLEAPRNDGQYQTMIVARSGDTAAQAAGEPSPAVQCL